MKICLVNNILDPFGRGSGTETIVKIIKTSLEKKGYSVFTLSLKPKRGKVEIKNAYYLKSYFFVLNKMSLFLKLFWHFIDFFNFINFIKIFFIFKKEKPNLVITNNLMGLSLSLVFLIKILKIKHIHILHDIQLIHPSGLVFYKKENVLERSYVKIYYFITRFLIASPNYVISPSEWLLNIHERKGFFKKSKKEVIPNPALTNENQKQGKGKNNFFSFLFVGQLEEHKGVDLLLKAFKVLQEEKKQDDFQLRFVGSGSLLEKIKSYHLKNLYVLGRKNNDEVKEEMINADCLIVPSICYENSPTVIYEAFSTNLLVLAANLGGISELIGDGRGVSFKAGSFQDLALKMEEVKKNLPKNREIILKAKEFVVYNSAGEYFSKINKIINSI